MSPDQVKKLYPSLIHKDGVWAVLGQKIANHPAALLFIFAQEKLTVVAVVFDESYVNNNNYLRDYDELKPLLAKKYGAAVADREEWSQDLYKDDPSEWGMAVATGQLRKWTNFETPKTSVQLVLSGENFKINFGIRYASRELESLNDQANEASKASGL